MFIPNITPESLAREIASKLIGDRAVAMNNVLNALQDFPVIQRLMSILLNPVPGQMTTGQELSAAMNELLNLYNRNTDDNSNLNPIQKEVAKLANYAFVSMVYDSILSRLRIVAVSSRE